MERPGVDFVYGGQVRRVCRDHYREIAREYRLRNHEHYKAYHKARNEKDRPAHRQRQKDILARSRRQVLEHYGGTPPRCACCGETTFEFLALDHTDGGGTKHRREHTNGLGGLKTYRWAIRNGFPSIFRVLCHNCNSAFGFYGYCPHQTERL